MMEKCELFSHKADMGIRGIGPSFERAFEQGALALTSVLVDPQKVKAEIAVPIFCTSPKMDTLFYDWVNEIIFEMACRHLVFGRYTVKITQVPKNQFSLEGKAWGEHVNPEHEPAVEIKGATFTELKAETTDNGECVVQCVVDV